MTYCPDCPLVGRCTPMLCEWQHSDDPVQRAHVAHLAGRPRAEPSRAEIEARRAGKVRLPLGVKPAPGRR